MLHIVMLFGWRLLAYLEEQSEAGSRRDLAALLMLPPMQIKVWALSMHIRVGAPGQLLQDLGSDYVLHIISYPSSADQKGTTF